MTELEKDCLFVKLLEEKFSYSCKVFENDGRQSFDISQVTKGHT